MESDRRAHPRFPLILAVQYLGAEAIVGYTENLSAGGLFIRTEREFRVGERVSLVLALPQLVEPVELEVEVVRWRDAAPGAPAGVAVIVPEELTEHRARLAAVARELSAARPPEPAFRVLLVEDNALVASMYTAALRRFCETDHVTGLGIEVAAGGEEAYRRLVREPRIDLLVTDVFMPGVSGIDLVERIRAEQALAELPIVVITSGGERERQQLASFGISLFLQKPVKYEELVATVRHLFPRKEGKNGADVPLGEKVGDTLTDGAGMAITPADAKPASRR